MRKFAVFCLILLVGLSLRCYNLNSPSIGYHNMMENESLIIAQEMIATGDYAHKRLYFENAFVKNPVVTNNSRPPLVSYQIILAWKVLGENLWGARLFNVLFGLASIVVVYLLSYLLFENRTLALGSSAFLAVMPLAIFFSRNLQAESPAFFFMLLGNFFYLRFIKRRRIYNLILGALSFFISWLYGFNFIFGALPFLFCFPFKEIARDKKDFRHFTLALLLPFASFLLFFLWLKQPGGSPGFILSPQVFSPGYWMRHATIISSYANENFTPVINVLALLGVIFAFLKGSGLLSRYIIGWTLCAFVYAAFFSEQLYQQSFIQMPFLVMFAVSSSSIIGYFSENIKRPLKKDLLVYLLATAVITGAFFAYSSVRRMHAMVFIGEDVAGESLKEFTKPGERVFLSTYAQGYGISRYAQRYVGWERELGEFQKKEKEFNIRYICFYPAEYARALKDENPKLFDYIRENYHEKEIGFIDEPNKLFYIILERGKGSDPKTFLDSFSGPKRLRTIYKISGRYVFFYSISPPAEEPKS